MGGCSKGRSAPAPARPVAPPAPVAEQDELLLIAGCEIRSRAGELLRVFPGVHCVYLPDGDLVAFTQGHLTRTSGRGKVRWQIEMDASFLDLADDGNLVLLTHSVHPYKGRAVVFDAIEHRGTDGRILWRWDTFEHIADLQRHHPPHPLLDEIPYREGEEPPFQGVPSVLFRSPGYVPGPDAPKAALRARLPPFNFLARLQLRKGGPPSMPEVDPDPEAPARPAGGAPGPSEMPGAMEPVRYEYYHTNSVQRLGPNPVHPGIAAFRPGNFLLSMCNFSMLAIIDAQTGKVVWTYALPGYFPGQHDAQLLPNGHILMFVNSDVCESGYCSAVVEFDPVTRRDVWKYRPEPPDTFHSVFMGSAQRLANGNTLISSMGEPARIFEVTPGKQVVWSWNVPGRNEPRPLTIRRVPAAPLARLLSPF